MSRLVLATRQSQLALWQANYIKDRLEKAHAGLMVELLPLTTEGDRRQREVLSEIGGKGLFVKELEIAMLEKRADFAVHSLKDVPMELPAGLGIEVMCQRHNPYDALVSPQKTALADLPAGAVIGTSSLRRQLQVKAHYPHLKVKNLRGNVDTRLRRLNEGDYDAIILAAAGLQRLGLEENISEILNSEIMLPAITQGVLALECRQDDHAVLALLQCLADAKTTQCALAERALSQGLNGGCQAPVGGFAQMIDERTIAMEGLVGDPSGIKIIKRSIQGPASEAVKLGQTLANEILNAGGEALLSAFR